MPLKSLIFLLATVCLVTAIPPPHPVVLAVRLQEDLLPAHLKSSALHNSHTRQVLRLTSLLHGEEQPVYGRDTDHIPRSQIYNILTHAGFAPKNFHQPIQAFHSSPQLIPSHHEFQQPIQSLQHHSILSAIESHNPFHQDIPISHHLQAIFEDPPFFHHSDGLQHL